MKVQRYKYKNDKCNYAQQENIPFATCNRSSTHCFDSYVVGLLKSMILKDVADLPNITLDTLKNIHLNYLKRRYSPTP